jgi:hypothetical protein
MANSPTPATSHGSSASASALTLLSTTTIGTAAAFDVATIDQTYNDLVLVLIARSSAAIGSDQPQLRFNNDSGANYFDETVRGNGSTASAFGDLAATSAALSLTCPAASSGLANTFGFHTIEVQGYTSTTWRKGILCFAGGGPAVTANNTVPHAVFAWWNSTAAVNRINLTPLTTPFTWVTGSVLRIYGRL